MNRLSKHFLRSELADELTDEVVLAEGFLEKLEDLRVAYGFGMIVTDGCRSGETNDWLIRRGFKASPNSFHLMSNKHYDVRGTCAVDVARPNGILLHRLQKFASAADWSIGLGATFVHLDRRVDYTDDMEPVQYTY